VWSVKLPTKEKQGRHTKDEKHTLLCDLETYQAVVGEHFVDGGGGDVLDVFAVALPIEQLQLLQVVNLCHAEMEEEEPQLRGFLGRGYKRVGVVHVPVQPEHNVHPKWEVGRFVGERHDVEDHEENAVHKGG
jgi:hypothetical protein